MEQRFELGQLVATPASLELLEECDVSPSYLLEKHQRGDWGSVPKADARENEYSIKHGFRVVSSYDVGDEGRKVWILTEADRSVTTILLPEEY